MLSSNPVVKNKRKHNNLTQKIVSIFSAISAFLRRLQQGSVRLYVAYVMAAMVLVLVWGALYK